MELTAEYLESKGWVESDKHPWIFKQQFYGISYGVYVNQDKCISLFSTMRLDLPMLPTTSAPKNDLIHCGTQ